MSDTKSGLLSRWQQRLTKVKEEEQALEASLQQPAPAEVELPAEDNGPDAVAQAETESVSDSGEAVETDALPDPDAIEEGGSFAQFLAEGIDPDKKKSALQALWRQPQYNVTDGMAEYALDYSNQPKLSTQVAKEVAKKVFRHLDAKLEEERRQEALAKARAEAPALDEKPSELPIVAQEDGQNDPSDPDIGKEQQS
ncbi:DUF3306 domain-containing protein [Ferrimonas sp. SCSIO 43195]|uniref:DUF3306 domain-containing protein n=1 Tax=Ferrimonas sp. SCSIO 43195 TaxID=2822844 RepID=UPI0020757476|nr:DUF3306 domain-containing protein [Ferrimonas sp. SCSIO 43195]USD37514.1 DUF3306 domain-containing protein [Ferrimonas sp. SCSIO 43195]